jgi:LmbE family N-acetylglucosaminyl deacetylase
MDTIENTKKSTLKNALRMAQRPSTAFQFTRLENGEKQRATQLSDVMKFDDASDERWLMVSPHDDDVTLGAGLLIQAAIAERIDVRTAVVTDGRMGYCTIGQKDAIVDIRRRETDQSFEILGIPQEKVSYLNFPDGGLAEFRGRRAAKNGEPSVGGFTGLQNAFTHLLREVRPTRVFVPTIADLHPDHQITNAELMISLFHAGGSIWPELGDALVGVPKVYELAVYCDFPEPPQIEVKSDAAAFENKLASIAAYQSQTQIGGLIDSLRASGPYEYIRELNFKLYSATHYKKAFA